MRIRHTSRASRGRMEARWRIRTSRMESLIAACGDPTQAGTPTGSVPGEFSATPCRMPADASVPDRDIGSIACSARRGPLLGAWREAAGIDRTRALLDRSGCAVRSMVTMQRALPRRFTAALTLAAIALTSPACEKKKPDGDGATGPTSTAPASGSSAADAAPSALVLRETGLGGVNAGTPGTLAGVRAALPGLEIRDAEIAAGEGETSRGFDVVRHGHVIAQIVLDDAGKVSFIDATGDGEADAIRTSDGIAVGASFDDVRGAGADRCEVVKTAGDQIDDWPDATCLREGGHIRYELQIEEGAPAPEETGPVSSLRARVVRVLWFARADDAILK